MLLLLPKVAWVAIESIFFLFLVLVLGLKGVVTSLVIGSLGSTLFPFTVALEDLGNTKVGVEVFLQDLLGLEDFPIVLSSLALASLIYSSI